MAAATACATRYWWSVWPGITWSISPGTPGQLTPESPGQFQRNLQFQQAVRLYACYQVSLGKRPQELESVYETSFKSICNWVNRLNQGGVEALIDKVKPGRNNRLEVNELKAVKAVLLNKKPADYGYNSATWTGPLLIEWIKKEYQVDYKKAQIYNILKKLGLTFQKGKGVYPEAEDREEKVSALKKTPRVKGG